MMVWNSRGQDDRVFTYLQTFDACQFVCRPLCFVAKRTIHRTAKLSEEVNRK